MPLMLLNLRALPNGLESHKGFLKSELDSWLAGGLEEADVTFICTGVEGEAGKTVRLAVHQVRQRCTDIVWSVIFLSPGSFGAGL